ncbi:hypothetical protein [Ktedonospora formicarum]|uniref:Uncharacterized protein n=1 Tax=Ktedonospora formicarum TaxID=2778364 RepID=A0A8J3I400_9CHLR|nr:hypothetical protein [Ktedonospora formicarum]GHO45019.1 hypothetical protein KSX_31820 [Ktedonospora formicarum]
MIEQTASAGSFMLFIGMVAFLALVFTIWQWQWYRWRRQRRTCAKTHVTTANRQERL